jgi:hypothetical protein
MSPDSPDREELFAFLKLAMLFIVLILGREAGRIYSSYTEVSQLSIIFDVREEELAGFVREFMEGGDPDLRVGLMLSIPSAQSIEGHVTKVPDYARRWLISVYLSAVVVRQPEVSDVEIQLWVEDELLEEQAFSFVKEPVPYSSLLKRNMSLSIGDAEAFRGAVLEASDCHGGEVEFRFNGTVDAHLLWMRMQLPFFTLRYPLVTAPRFEILSSGWVGFDGAPVSEGIVGREVYVSARFENLARVHSVWENVSVSFYEVGSHDPIGRITKTVGIAPQTAGSYVFPFTPEREGVYSYVIEASGERVWEGSATFMAWPDG